MSNCETNLSCPLASAARLSPTATAFESSEQALNFEELNILVARICTTLKQRQWSKVCINRSTACIETIAVVLAILRVGGQVALLNPRIGRSTLQEQLEMLSPDLILSDHNSLQLNDTPSYCEQWSLNADLILFTSGSSGKPKAVTLPALAILKHAQISNQRTQLDHQSGWLVSLPLHHVGGLLIPIRTIVARGRFVLSTSLKRADIVECICEITSVSCISLVPEMLLEIFQLGFEQRLSSLEFILLGGGRLSKPLLKYLAEFNLPILVGYGSTETCSHITLGKLQDLSNSNGFAGQPLAEVDIRIIEQGSSDRAPRIGRIWINSPTLFRGYLPQNDFEQPLEISKEGFATQDIGYLSNTGDLYIVSRIDEVINSGGEKIHPSQIETALSPLDCKALGFPHYKWGSRPVLFIRENKDCLPSVLKICAELPSLLRPEIIILITTWPMTASGKIAYAQLREKYQTKITQEMERNRKELSRKELSRVPTIIYDDRMLMDGDS